MTRPPAAAAAEPDRRARYHHTATLGQDRRGDGVRVGSQRQAHANLAGALADDVPLTP